MQGQRPCLAPAGARHPLRLSMNSHAENSLKQSAQRQKNPSSLPACFRLPVLARLCSLMHRQKAPRQSLRFCGQAVHNHACISAKPGKWRKPPVHRKVIHRVWTLWMILRPQAGFPLSPAAGLHKRQFLCIIRRTTACHPAGFWAAGGYPPQRCGRFGVFIHMLSHRQNAGITRVCGAFPQFPHALLLLRIKI